MFYKEVVGNHLILFFLKQFVHLNYLKETSEFDHIFFLGQDELFIFKNSLRLNYSFIIFKL